MPPPHTGIQKNIHPCQCVLFWSFPFKPPLWKSEFSRGGYNSSLQSLSSLISVLVDRKARTKFSGFICQSVAFSRLMGGFHWIPASVRPEINKQTSLKNYIRKFIQKRTKLILKFVLLYCQFHLMMMMLIFLDQEFFSFVFWDDRDLISIIREIFIWRHCR